MASPENPLRMHMQVVAKDWVVVEIHPKPCNMATMNGVIGWLNKQTDSRYSCLTPKWTVLAFWKIVVFDRDLAIRLKLCANECKFDME